MNTRKEVETDVTLKMFWLEDPPVATWKYFSHFHYLLFGYYSS